MITFFGALGVAIVLLFFILPFLGGVIILLTVPVAILRVILEVLKSFSRKPLDR